MGIKVVQISHTELLIKAPDFIDKDNWEFLLTMTVSFSENNSESFTTKTEITASIADNNFWQKVKGGQIRTFYAGVKLPCVLKLEYEVNELGVAVPNSSTYIVTEVTGAIILPNLQ